MSKFYTCEEVAEMYRVKVTTVWEWIREKKLNALQIGKSYRIRQSDIDAFEKNGNKGEDLK